MSECSHGGVLHLFRFFVCSNPAKCDFSFFFVYGAQSILISTSAIQVYFFLLSLLAVSRCSFIRSFVVVVAVRVCFVWVFVLDFSLNE